MLRRVHTPQLRVGQITLDGRGSKHARDVLRLENGAKVEVFDDAGNIATASIIELHPHVVVQVESLASSREESFTLTIASAIPKGERADWMIEKLSELGVSRFIPLATERSVVLPEGRNKRDRWIRIATESAKQSRRAGVMQIEELTTLAAFVSRVAGPCFYLAPDATTTLSEVASPGITLLIGPEGGWTDSETAQFAAAGIAPVKLTDTILRIETAAIAAAAVVMTLAARASSNPLPRP